ncbi:TetR/AcrR family transcriptional regulator [Aliikangiella marina]|uniref:TetR/AcrR family transcriptional regulator n=1 Tax=Aliikangiella marina TaxID=1712262 RepID=A0A545T1L8_9GAMM|nr:TetR/AcrR family transcriptional regulator [Aliikangiella marina]TQV71106.1 TetR/AcrR family transcriptional regulator [Aliikangiella marina]
MAAGRNRSFDKETALKKAMEVFWKNGYSGTSLSDLTAAMNINKPSMYAAFGNKEALFTKALDYYLENFGKVHAEQLNVKNMPLDERLEGYLLSISDMVSDQMLPGGCFITGTTCEAGSDCLPSSAVDRLVQINQQTKEALVEFFNQESLNVTATSSPEELADYLMVQQFGLAVMARTGAPKAQLEKIAKQAVSSMVRQQTKIN